MASLDASTDPSGPFASALARHGGGLPAGRSPSGPFASARAVHGRPKGGRVLGLGPPVAGPSPPAPVPRDQVEITNVGPEELARFGAILFDVLETDGGTVRATDQLVIRVRQGGRWETAFWFGAFADGFKSSIVLPRAHGHHFQIRRLDGWDDNPGLEAWAYGAPVP